MRFILGILTTVILTVGLSLGQSAKVIKLDQEDAAKAQHVHEELKAAKKAVDEIDEEIELKYTTFSQKYDWHVGDISSCHHFGGTWNNKNSTCSDAKVTLPQPKEGWALGFEYSEDWAFIVPKRSITIGNTTLDTCITSYTTQEGTYYMICPSEKEPGCPNPCTMPLDGSGIIGVPLDGSGANGAYLDFNNLNKDYKNFDNH